MSYIISSKKLKVDYREKHIHAMLDLYNAGKDISNSPIIEWGRRTLKRGWWFYGIEELPQDQWEEGIQKRQQDIIALYEQMKEQGYNGSEISVYFNKKSGAVNIYDGYHRISILNYLGITANMNCIVSYHHPIDENMRGDFPLADRLKEINRREVLYQPMNDPRVKGWKLWRPDSQKRLDIVISSLINGSVLDVGCETGWFSRELSRRGYQVTGIDKDPRRLAIARYLSIIQNVDVELLRGFWHIELEDRSYDNVLMFSMLHHDVLACGVEQTLKRLETLRKKCKRLIVEFPLRADLVKWLPQDKKSLWKFSLEEWTDLLEKHTCMTVIDVQTAQLKDRPIIVMS